ncbi:tubulin-folding cofactor C-like [Curcuma longa]|uniref:tubulin-folding cofactor C-like n=1 Tax=Curcuma longa TaxID=136217 RepID=UPI003D9F59D1
MNLSFKNNLFYSRGPPRYFSPSYKIRSFLKAISLLKETWDAVNSELLFGKKFFIKNKTFKKDLICVIREKSMKKKAPSLQKLNLAPEDWILIKHFSSLSPISLLVRSISTNCRVYAGPVLGLILIEEVHGRLLMLASHQIRIHRARATDLCLWMRSRPITEDYDAVRFAPCRLFDKAIDVRGVK